MNGKIGYELAKQLKDMGFPQEDGQHLTPQGWIVSTRPHVRREWAFLPNHRQLMAACGNSLLLVEQVAAGFDGSRGEWLAVAKSRRRSCCWAFAELQEEALAHLWLMLKKESREERAVTSRRALQVAQSVRSQSAGPEGRQAAGLADVQIASGAAANLAPGA